MDFFDFGLFLRIIDEGTLKRDRYLESNVLVRSHQSERVDESEVVDERDEDAGGDDAEQTAEEDHHSELETPERHELLQAEQHTSDRRSEGHCEPGRRARRHKVPPAAYHVSC